MTRCLLNQQDMSNKKTYITLNTLIDDESIDRVCKMLDEISFYGTDGMIIQDFVA